jgi:hypothetical protein
MRLLVDLPRESPGLLGPSDVAGAPVIIDAMACRKQIAAAIRRGEEDDVLAVEQNQPTLYERVEAAIDVASEQEGGGPEEHGTSEEGHGRREARTYAIVLAPESIDPEGPWCDPKAVGVASSERFDGRGLRSLQARHDNLSRALMATVFAEGVRSH